MGVSRKPPKPETINDFIEQADDRDISFAPSSTPKRPNSKRQSDIRKNSNHTDITSTPIKASTQTDATPKAEMISKRGSIQPLKLRIPDDLLADIDAIVEQEKPKISRHTWILRTLYERIAQEQK